MRPSSEERGRPESEDERALRIAWIRAEVLSGDYFVPGELVARSMLRRIPLEVFGLQHQ